MSPSVLPFLAARILLSAAASAGTVEPVLLQPGPHAGVEISETDRVWTITTTGPNPHFWLTGIPDAVSADTHPVLAFDYFALDPVPALLVRIPTADGALHFTAGALPLAETWKPFGIDLRLADIPYASGPGKQFAILLGTPPGHRLQIRNLRLRAPIEAERLAMAERERVRQFRTADAEAYLEYVRTEHPLTFRSITVTPGEIVLEADLPETGPAVIALLELPAHLPSHAPLPANLPPLAEQAWGAGPVAWRIPRFDGQRDRSTSRWVLAGRSWEGFLTRLTPARYPSHVTPEASRSLDKPVASGIKGLGGIPPGLTPDHEIFGLGIAHATVNMVVNAMLSPSPQPGWEPWTFEGRPHFLNPGYLGSLDRTVKALSDRKIIVSAILLIGNNRDGTGTPTQAMVHPEALADGKFAMPDLLTPEGCDLYRAVIHLLTERYTRESGEFGRVSNWILHNEINQAGTWTNMGEQPLPRYLETFHRSARLVHHSARRYDPHARVFVSLTHHWTEPVSGLQTYVVRDLLDLFAEAARAEGDFPWGVAYHPYPRSLFNPRAWEDDVPMDFGTRYITPKNIAVLPAYLSQPRFLHEGKLRCILLSEQGLNAPSLSPEDQRLQAAGLVYTMNRVRQTPGIEAFHYHAYRDSPEAEGGLLLGLTNPEHGRKVAWDVYAALGTDRETEACSFAWPIIGVSGPEALPQATLPPE